MVLRSALFCADYGNEFRWRHKFGSQYGCGTPSSATAIAFGQAHFHSRRCAWHRQLRSLWLCRLMCLPYGAVWCDIFLTAPRRVAVSAGAALHFRLLCVIHFRIVAAAPTRTGIHSASRETRGSACCHLLRCTPCLLPCLHDAYRNGCSVSRNLCEFRHLDDWRKLANRSLLVQRAS